MFPYHAIDVENSLGLTHGGLHLLFFISYYTPGEGHRVSHMTLLSSFSVYIFH